MRIVSALLERGDIANRQQLLEYIKYTEEIGEYFQIYSIPSVMLYDHRYREKQAKENIPWATSDVHSVNYYLRPSFYTRSINQDKTSIPTKSTGIPNVQKDKNGQNICRDYQTENGCKRCMCKFSHVCTVCNEKHPAYLHKLIKGKQQTLVLGAVPKTDSNDIRLIQDVSRPLNRSLNSYASVEKTHYTSIDKVCSILKPNGYLAKLDLSQAY